MATDYHTYKITLSTSGNKVANWDFKDASYTVHDVLHSARLFNEYDGIYIDGKPATAESIDKVAHCKTVTITLHRDLTLKQAQRALLDIYNAHSFVRRDNWGLATIHAQYDAERCIMSCYSHPDGLRSLQVDLNYTYEIEKEDPLP